MLRPSLGLQVGDLRYEQLAGLELRRGLLPIVDRLICRLPAGTEFSAELGDEVTLELDGGEGSAAVFTGELTAIRHGLRRLELRAHGPALTLARARPAASFEKLTLAEIVERVCDEAGVDFAMDGGEAQSALFVCEGRSTALELIVRVLRAAGLRGGFDGAGSLQIGEHGPDGELALRYGRELVDLSSCARAPDPNTAYVAGEGGGAPDSDEGLWVAADFAAGGGTPAGTGVRWRAEPLMRTVDDAQTAAAGWTGELRRRAAPVRLRTWLLPSIAPGARLELHDLPEHLPLSECRVRQIVHHLRPGGRQGGWGGRSEIWASAETGGAGDFAGMLGSLAGAVGGLL